ncbi:MAG: hypothetical protein JW720_02680 [Sedimentisphaerales bacterium]|nr:hypothetical protein [Sedimentisphaerales bacterium]
MANDSKGAFPVMENRRAEGTDDTGNENVLKFKKRMLEWPNPVEYVNNMYGCHPDDDDNEYFKVIFTK